MEDVVGLGFCKATGLGHRLPFMCHSENREVWVMFARSTYVLRATCVDGIGPSHCLLMKAVFAPPALSLPW